jgi:AcrR family transcriptional regulator
MEKAKIPPLDADAPARGTYQRGLDTRERLLMEGMIAFGLHGFQGASARAIAAQAQVKLPAIGYYFGNKEGLYLACAEYIVQQHLEAAAGASLIAKTALASGADSVTARRSLGVVVRAVASLYLGANNAPAWSMFVQRELAHPGPAFNLLLDQLWRPAIEIIAGLISSIRGPGADMAAARADAIWLMGGVTFFGNGRSAFARIITRGDDAQSYIDELDKVIDRVLAKV